MEFMTSMAMMTMIPFIFIGLFFIGLGYLIRYIMRKRLHRCSERVSAKVVDFDQYQVRMNRNLRKDFCRPLVEFTAGKEVVRAVPPNGAVKRAYDIGEDIMVYYNPNKPDEMIIRHEFEKEIRKTFLVCVIAGLCIPIIGIILGQLAFMLMELI